MKQKKLNLKVKLTLPNESEKKSGLVAKCHISFVLLAGKNKDKEVCEEKITISNILLFKGKSTWTAWPVSVEVTKQLKAVVDEAIISYYKKQISQEKAITKINKNPNKVVH